MTANLFDHHSLFLILAASVSVIGLIVLIAVVKLNPFISLLLASLGLAFAARMSLSAIVHSFEAGLGNTLGHIAVVVALGTMLGKMMAESGGADQIALHSHSPLRREERSLGHGRHRTHHRPARIL